MQVKVVIDGREVECVTNGVSSGKTYHKFKEPEPFASMATGESPLIVSIYVKPGFFKVEPEEAKASGEAGGDAVIRSGSL